MPLTMREDSHHIEMEDISAFPLERSHDCQDWESIDQKEVSAILDALPDDRVKVFLGVLRSGSFPRLDGYYYRIRPKNRNYT